MRLLSLIALFILSSTINLAQLELVESYDSVARLIYLSDNEPAIFMYDASEAHIELYKTDLTLIADIEIPIEYGGSGHNIFHVSRTLFDCDSTNIEYMISHGSQFQEECFVNVMREDGTILFELPEHTFHDEDNVGTNPTLGSSMIEDEEGVLFVFYEGSTHHGETKVFRSCGSIPRSCRPCNADGSTVGISELGIEKNNFSLYPNPGNNQFALEYELSSNYSSATLSVYDMAGREVIKKLVGPSMNRIIVDSSSLVSGRYQVILRTENGVEISASYIEI